LFEKKNWFSIIFFYFHKSDNKQDRFHTHAFDAWSFRIFGNYIEEKLTDLKVRKSKDSNESRTVDFIMKFPRNLDRWIFIPKNTYHRITKSKGCLTLLLSGKWDETWNEYFPEEKKTITYSHNRIIKQETKNI
jgi:hypothetical protein